MAPAVRPPRSGWLVLSLALALTGTGCASTISGQGSAVAPTSSAPVPAPTPVQSTPVAPSLTPRMTTSAVAALPDITRIHYVQPRGFVRSHSFHPVTPLEPIDDSYYFVPGNERAGLDVMSITLYRLPASAHVDSVEQQKARVRLYNRRASARVQHGLNLTVVGGRLAIQENAVEPPNFRYAAWFVFGRRHFVQVSCQVDQQVNTIARGCQALLNSLELT